MNPFHFFTRAAVEEFERRFTQFLIHNPLFQSFAHQSSKKVQELSNKVRTGDPPILTCFSRSVRISRSKPSTWRSRKPRRLRVMWLITLESRQYLYDS